MSRFRSTDAPFRETAAEIKKWRDEGALAVEMEAASLYAFVRARGRRVLCFALVTNAMAQSSGDFEKGSRNGATDTVALLESVIRALDEGTA